MSSFLPIRYFNIESDFLLVWIILLLMHLWFAASVIDIHVLQNLGWHSPSLQ